jgi:glycosyltransferase involved in cell wall biosynthesis
MSDTRPILYLLDASVATTGAFVAARSYARMLADEIRLVLTLPAHHRFTPEQLHDFWRVDTVPMTPLRRQPLALLRYLPRLIYASILIRWRMHRDAAQAILLNDFYLLHGVLLRLMLYRGRMLCWVRCLPQQFAGGLAPALLWLNARASSQIIAVSQHVARHLPARLQARLGYDCFEGGVQSSASNRSAAILYLANYIPGKGQEMALEAFAIAAREDPSLRLQFYGDTMGNAANRDYRQRLEARAQALGVAGQVQFGEAVNDPHAALAEAFLALNFSNSESFSMTVLEAAGAGVPVIATRCGGPEEILRHGETGYLVPVGDIVAAATAITTLSRDRVLATRLGNAAREDIAARFSPAQTRLWLKALMQPSHRTTP